MQITQKKSIKKRVILTSSIVAALLIGSIAFAYTQHIGPFRSAPTSQTNLKPATSAQKQAGEQQKKQTAIPNQDTKQNLPTTTDAGNDQALAVTITALNQNGSTVQIRSLIQAVVNGGTCTLTLTKGNVTVTKTSNILPLSSSSTCEGFDIPTNELSSGTWNVNLAVSSGGISGSTTNKITVQ